MRFLRVAAATLNQTPLDWVQNRANILQTIESARSHGVAVLCLPELCITGYNCEDAFHSPDVVRRAANQLVDLLPHTKGLVVALGLPIFYQNGLYNAACLIANGQILGFVAKQNLASEGIHYEPRWFQPWPAGQQCTIDFAGNSYPFGDVAFDVGGLIIGFEICEDAWAASRPGTLLSGYGADIILNPSASHFAFGKHEVRKRFVLEGSRAFGVAYVYANLNGNEAGRAIYDGGALIAAGGDLLAAGPRFSYSDFNLTAATIDLDRLRLGRSRASGVRTRVAQNRPQPVRTAFAPATASPETPCLQVVPWESINHLKEEEFARAIALGLFDYMRKSRSQGFVVSLSGGADSTAVVLLVALMRHFGEQELGTSEFLKRSGLRVNSSESLMQKLLCCVYQSTQNSSEVTRNSARTIAQAVGSQFFEFNVQQLVEQYTSLIEGATGEQLTWEKHDLSLQNIQARVRGPSVWLLANLRNSLLLATSNRSEAAVGYATMDGDTCGGLSPIAGIDKAFLLHWLSWMESTGPTDHGPLPCLSVVTAQAPTAELRPQGTGQTDEADLMPYPVLDAIERLAIRDKKAPAEVLPLLATQFCQYSKAELTTWIDRFFTLWCRNQWKRERYAPSFHVDDENLDPKTWCRFPILSGGFIEEIKELNLMQQLQPIVKNCVDN